MQVDLRGMSMDITIYDPAMPGLARACDTEGCHDKAVSIWSTGVIAGGASAGRRYSCALHNPMANVAVPLPMSFHSQSLCHACGQPVSIGPQQVVYPGTAWRA